MFEVTGVFSKFAGQSQNRRARGLAPLLEYDDRYEWSMPAVYWNESWLHEFTVREGHFEYTIDSPRSSEIVEFEDWRSALPQGAQNLVWQHLYYERRGVFRYRLLRQEESGPVEYDERETVLPPEAINSTWNLEYQARDGSFSYHMDE